MKNITEISRRCEYAEETQICGCGPMFFSVIIAEIEIDDNGEKIYLESEWVSDVPDELLYTANKKSIYEYLIMRKEPDEEFQVLQNSRIEMFFDDKSAKKSKYAKQYKELKEMIIEKIKEKDIDSDLVN